jgi:hypothetical protein
MRACLRSESRYWCENEAVGVLLDVVNVKSDQLAVA